MRFSDREIYDICENNYLKGFIIAEVVERDKNGFASLYEILAVEIIKDEARRILNESKNLGLEVIMIQTFDSDSDLAYFSDRMFLKMENMTPSEIAESMRVVFKPKNESID